LRDLIRGAIPTLLACLLISRVAVADELSLQQAVDIALKNNPSVAAGFLSADAAREAARGARALANPEFTVAPSVIGDAGSDSALLLTQPLEINGARRVRGQVAGFQAAAAGCDAEATSRELVLRVKQLYWDTALAQQLAQLQQDNIAYLQALDKAARKQVDVGTSPGAQVIKTEVELGRAGQELAQAQLDLGNTRAALSTLLNRPAGQDLTLADQLEFSSPVLDKDKLVAAAVSARPEVRSAASQLTASRRQIAAAKLRLAPDVVLQARKETFDGDGGIAVSVTLPIFDWGSVRAEKRQAETASLGKQKELEAVRNSVALDVEQAVRAVETAARIVREYQGGILDKSAQLAAMAQKGYEKGATGYLEVLEAQRTHRNVRREYLSALAGHARAVAQLEWAAGIDLKAAEVKK
jgi:outer membrane protein, heavy metal efflux system